MDHRAPAVLLDLADPAWIMGRPRFCWTWRPARGTYGTRISAWAGGPRVEHMALAFLRGLAGRARNIRQWRCCVRSPARKTAQLRQFGVFCRPCGAIGHPRCLRVWPQCMIQGSRAQVCFGYCKIHASSCVTLFIAMFWFICFQIACGIIQKLFKTQPDICRSSCFCMDCNGIIVQNALPRNAAHPWHPRSAAGVASQKSAVGNQARRRPR